MSTERRLQSSADHSDLSTRAIPRLSPYDAIVLVTTISFGVVKAVTTSNGNVIASITVEWIVGVLLYLLLFFIGLYKTPKSDTLLVKWLFYSDCTTFLRQRNTSPAVAVDEEEDLRPMVTGDRLAVSFTVLILGAAKAIASYRGLNSTANSLDWVFGVVITSLTYCLEMYTEDTPKAWPSFFMTDYKPFLSSGTIIIGICAIYILAFGASSAWTIYWYTKLLRSWAEPIDFSDYARPTMIDGIHDFTLRLLGASLLVLAIALGVLGCALVVILIIVASFGNIAPLAKVVRSLSRMRTVIEPLLPLSIRPNPTSPIGSLLRRIRSFWSRYFVHIVMHLLAMATAAILAIFFLGFPIRLRSDTRTSNVLIFIDIICSGSIMGCMGLMSCYGIYKILVSLFNP